jgi:acetyl esterase/lipase
MDAAAAALGWLTSAAGSLPSGVWFVLLGVVYYLVSLYNNQEAMLYHPVIPGTTFKTPEDNPPPFNDPSNAPFSLDYEDHMLRTLDGVRIHVWLVRTRASLDASTAPTLVFFHANAGNVGFRIPTAAEFVDGLGCNILLVEYRGYGRSEGVPSEAGLERDADAAMVWLQTRPDIDQRKIFVFGQSLGGAVAIRAAVNHMHAVAGEWPARRERGEGAWGREGGTPTPLAVRTDRHLPVPHPTTPHAAPSSLLVPPTPIPPYPQPLFFLIRRDR